MRGWLLLVLLVTLFAGCTEAKPDDVNAPLPDVQLTGMVRTVNFNPIEGATITLTGPGTVYSDGSQTEDVSIETATTDAAGNFTVTASPTRHRINIEADGYMDFGGFVDLPDSNFTVEMIPLDATVPTRESFDFDGSIQCAIEALIITPSCDTAIKEFNDAGTVFEDDSVFELTTPEGWQTVVLDVRFDPSGHETIDGLRASAYAADADAEVFSYERITQQAADGDFSLRIDAGMDYGDNVAAPDSDGGDGIRFEFYPQGHADDTVCIPEQTPEVHERIVPGQCFLGIGFTQDLTFTAKATIFIHEPAPAGWTTLGQA